MLMIMLRADGFCRKHIILHLSNSVSYFTIFFSCPFASVHLLVLQCSKEEEENLKLMRIVARILLDDIKCCFVVHVDCIDFRIKCNEGFDDLYIIVL